MTQFLQVDTSDSDDEFENEGSESTQPLTVEQQAALDAEDEKEFERRMAMVQAQIHASAPEQSSSEGLEAVG